MTAPDSLYNLVEKFERDISRFQQPDYNEAQLREAFVNPFFRALGWDLGEQVLHEAGLRSGGTIKHPDYTFLAGNRRAFYVETKKPSIDIGSSIEPAEQLRSYGWSGDTALGILTNFAEFAVYDCRIKPEQGDSPEEARVLYLTHGQYLDQWERLRAALSPEAVRQGAHRDLLEAEAKGVLRVDEAFLRDMESWRADLAEHLHKQARFIDRRLDQRELNHLVQRTIDRIVFLRIAEDRNLESYGRLERAAEVRRGVYNQIKTLYLAADKRYNSGLFHFDPADKSRPDADTLSLEIYIVDSVLRRIIRDLYPPKSRYQFSVISADILGQVYERFLGKVIEVRSDGETTEVSVEEKPEVRKAGGVYYTPGYIVDYIVENTVGALLRDKSPEEAARLRVLDPACGSGSFLTGAYQYLLDWHLKEYSKMPARWKNRIRHSPDGTLLRIEEKRRILLNNIYGVDLDQNAVEVSKLALLLKMLENEGDAAGIDELAEPLLPDLGGNIKWGNSLISSDFFAGAALADRDDEELYRVMPFDWAGGAGFGEIMRSGGFDAVIGNPPYVRQETLGREFKAYAKRHYETYAGTADLYTYFIERGVKLLNENGLFGIIVANKWMRARYGKPLRTWLKKQVIREIIDFGDLPVFQQATTYPCILTIGKAPHPPAPSRHLYGEHPKMREGEESRVKWDIPPDLERRMQAVARELRKNPTVAEDKLWQAIRKKQLDGRKFRRQVAIGAFVVDFYCTAERLAIEVDGPVHADQVEADRIRQQLIESLGIRFLRITNEEVERNLESALDRIRDAFYPHPQTPSPIKREGALSQSESALDSPSLLVGEGAGGWGDMTHFAAAQVDTLEFSSLREHVETLRYAVDKTLLDDGGWSLAGEDAQALLARLKTIGISLSEYVDGKLYYGIKTGLNEAFVIDEDVKDRLLEEDPNNAEFIKPFLAGREVKRFSTPSATRYLLLVPNGWTRQTAGSNASWNWFSNSYPAVATHLLAHKTKAMKRHDQGDFWWELRPCDYYDAFEETKIIYPNICKRPEFTLESEHQFTNQKCFIIGSEDKYLLGILNSQLMMFFFASTIPKLRGDFYEPGYAFMRTFPIRTIDFDKPADVEMHDDMVALVDEMLDLHRQLAGASAVKRGVLEALIERADRAIDGLVYRLYGLSGEEVGVVGGG